MDNRGLKAVTGERTLSTERGPLGPRALARLAMRAMSSTVPRTQALIALVLQLRFDEPTRVSLVAGLTVGVTATLMVLIFTLLGAPPDGGSTFSRSGSTMRWIRDFGWRRYVTRQRGADGPRVPRDASASA